jgi:hypothetical protein
MGREKRERGTGNRTAKTTKGGNPPERPGGQALELPFFAQGRRIVAAGGATPAAQRVVRNPWKRSCFNTSAPKEGRRKCRARASFRRPKNLLRPAGAKREERMMDSSSSSAFHGLARRAAVRPRRSTRGYIPTPHWGGNGVRRPPSAPGQDGRTSCRAKS